MLTLRSSMSGGQFAYQWTNCMSEELSKGQIACLWTNSMFEANSELSIGIYYEKQRSLSNWVRKKMPEQMRKAIF